MMHQRKPFRWHRIVPVSQDDDHFNERIFMKNATSLSVTVQLFILWIFNIPLAVYSSQTDQNTRRPPEHTIVTCECEEVFRIGNAPEHEEELFHGVWQPYIDDEMRLYVDDHSNSRILVFDMTGRFLLSMGKSGQGPGEFQRNWKIISGNTDEIVIHDMFARKLIYYLRDGTHLRDHYFGEQTGHDIVYPHYLSTGELFFCIKNRKEDAAKIQCSFMIADPETFEPRKIFSCIETWNAIYEKGRVAVSTIDYRMKVAVSPADEIYLVNSGTYIIDIFSRTGDKLRTITRDNYRRVERSAEDRNRVMGGSGDKRLYPSRYLDDITSIHFPLPHQCWVLPSRQEREKIVFDVFDGHGTLLHQAVLNVPEGQSHCFHVDRRTGKLYLYQVELSAYDEQMIACYHVHID